MRRIPCALSQMLGVMKKVDCSKCPHHLPSNCCALLRASACDPYEGVQSVIRAAARQALMVINGGSE